MTLPVRLVLDATAIAAYGRATVAVGETIVEVADSNAVVGLPVACLAEALAVDSTGRVEVLARHPAVRVLPLPAEVWPVLGAATALLRRVGAASAFLAAEEFDCDILTADPGRYVALGDDPPVIGI